MNKTERLYPLDALKGFFALTIVSFHLSGNKTFGTTESWFSFSYTLSKIFDDGSLGVQIFAVLSGFGIALSNSKKNVALSSPKEYFVKRFTALAPLAWFTTLLVVFIAAVQTKNFTISPIFLRDFLFLGGRIGAENPNLYYSINYPLWYLTPIVFSYILFYIISAKIQKSAKLEKSPIGGGGGNYHYLVISIIFLMFCTLNLGFRYVNGATFKVMCGFFTGCFVFEIWRRVRVSKHRLLIAALCVAISGYTLWFWEKRTIGDYMDIIFILTMLLAPTLIIAVLEFKPLNYALSFAPFRWLGSISYAVYCVHVPVFSAIDWVYYNVGWPRFSRGQDKLNFLIVMGVVLISAVIIHLFVEKPSKKVITSIYKKYFQV